MKKYFILGCFVISIILIFFVCRNYSSKVLKDYDGSIYFGNNEAYAMGVTEGDRIIFKDRNKALIQARKDYSEGFEAIKEEFNLLPVNKLNWKLYKTYGWQLTKADEEIKNQGGKISQFFDFYENNFEE